MDWVFEISELFTFQQRRGFEILIEGVNTGEALVTAKLAHSDYKVCSFKPTFTLYILSSIHKFRINYQFWLFTLKPVTELKVNELKITLTIRVIYKMFCKWVKAQDLNIFPDQNVVFHKVINFSQGWGSYSK